MAPMAPLDEAQDLKMTDNSSKWTLEDEMQRNERLRREDINTLRDFCLSLPKVDPSIVTTEVLVALLHATDFNLDRARTVATKYYDTRTGTPEVFANRHVENDDVLSAFEVGYTIVLPRRTPQGHRILLQSLRRTDPSLFDYASSSKVQFLTIDSCIHEDPTCPAFIFLYDMKGASMGHMLRWSLFLTRKIMKYLQEGIPLKIHRIHFINSSALTHKIIRILKPMINEQLYDMLKFHTADDFEEFWEYVPKECLPQEYGGHLPDLESLHKDHIEWLGKMQPKVDNISSTGAQPPQHNIN